MPTTLTLATIKSPLGELTLLQSADDTVHICEFTDRQERINCQIRQFYSGEHIVAGTLGSEIKNIFEQYFAGKLDALITLRTDPAGTPYERTVWETLRNIPAGAIDSYGTIAKRLHSSPRAVGRANGRNPISLIIPCHRVIGADGSLTGYAGGLDRKEWLLKHEGALLNI